MKRFLLFAFFAMPLWCQVAVTVPITIPAAHYVQVQAALIQQIAASGPITLSGALDASTTSFAVSAVPAGWTSGTLAARPATCTQQLPGNFALSLYFATDNGNQYTCVAANTYSQYAAAIVIDSEAMIVSGFSGNTVTVTRGTTGTTAATHLSGATVNVLLYPTVPLWFKQIIRTFVAQSIVTNEAAIQNAQAAITNSQNAGVQ